MGLDFQKQNVESETAMRSFGIGPVEFLLPARRSQLDTAFCTEALEEALKQATPDIFNTCQGCQFTSVDFTKKRPQEQEVQISMDSRGRAFDNIFNERLWRSVKYEDVYLKNYQTMNEAQAGLKNCFRFYNHERFHQALDDRTPREVHGVVKPNGSLSTYSQ